MYFNRSYFDYTNITYDEIKNDPFSQKIAYNQYRAHLAITMAIQGECWDKLETQYELLSDEHLCICIENSFLFIELSII